MMAVAPIRQQVNGRKRQPVRVFRDIGRPSAGVREMSRSDPFLKARRTFTAGPPTATILASSGERMAEAVGTMMRARTRRPRQLHPLRHSPARDALVADWTISLTTRPSIRSKTAHA